LEEIFDKFINRIEKKRCIAKSCSFKIFFFIRLWRKIKTKKSLKARGFLLFKLFFHKKFDKLLKYARLGFSRFGLIEFMNYLLNIIIIVVIAGFPKVVGIFR